MRRHVITALFFGLLLVGYLVAGPRQLGGPVSLVTTYGVSMEPTYHEGDLAILYERDAYEVGDVIGFTVPGMGPVLHRVIVLDGDRYITQGDNNDWVDSHRPTADEILGESIKDFTGGGAWAPFLFPAMGSALLALFWGLNKLGSLIESDVGDDEAGFGGVVGTSLQGARGSCPSGGRMVAAGAAIVGAIMFLTPTEAARPTVVGYDHEIELDWSANAQPSFVYPTGEVTAPSAVFLSEVGVVDFTASALVDDAVRGPAEYTTSVTARINNRGGWSRDFPLEVVDTDDASVVVARLDLAALRGMFDAFAERTGANGSAVTVEITAESVVTTALLGGAPTETMASASLSMELTDVSLRADLESIPVVGATQGSVRIMGTGARTFGVGPLAFSVPLLRILSVLVVLAALAWDRWGHLLVHRNDLDPDLPMHLRINQLHATSIIAVHGPSLPAIEKSVGVGSFDELHRIAKAEDVPILYEETDDGHVWATFAAGVWYWYLLAAQIALGPQAASRAPVPAADDADSHGPAHR